VALLLAGLSVCLAEVKVEVNGHRVRTSPSPVMRGGRVFVPLRTIADHLRVQLEWESSTQTVRFMTPKGQEVGLRIGNTKAKVGERTVTLESAPFIYLGATMIPLRFTAEAFDAEVGWSGSTQTVSIRKGGAGGQAGEDRRDRRQERRERRRRQQ
jgi:hypothetical protein